MKNFQILFISPTLKPGLCDNKVIRLLCHTEPITGLFQFSILDKEERKTIALISHGKSTKDDTLIPTSPSVSVALRQIGATHPKLTADLRPSHSFTM